MSAHPLPVPSLSMTGRVLVLVVAFFGWMCAGVDMSIAQLTGKAAAIDLLARSGSIDVTRFQTLNRQLQAKNDAKSPTQNLSASDLSQMKKWRALIAQWFAWYQCAFLFGAASGG